MRGARGRRLAVLSTCAGVLVVLVAGYLCRLYLVEIWWISRLGANDPKARIAAGKRLGEIGSERAARALLLTLREGSTLGDSAVEALGKIYPRVSSACRMRVIEGLLERLQGGIGERVLGDGEGIGHENLVQVLCALEPVPPEGYPCLVKACWDEESARPAAHLLAESWPGSRAAISGFLAGSAPQTMAVFYSAIVGKRAPRAKLALEIPRFFALNHEKPEARALALSFVEDPAILKEVFLHDPSRIPRIAAIRISGWLKDTPGNLDLSVLLFTEDDPLLLREIIQARSIWALGSSYPQGVELCDGLICNWMDRKYEEISFDESELERLAEILGQATDPALRDAASLAATLPKDYQEKTLPGLKIHEWGVWSDGDGALLPAGEVLADLPGFVHRRQVSTAKLWEKRSVRSLFMEVEALSVLKPVLFFYSGEPVSLDVQVRFQQGRPWTFYPDATDYLESVGYTPAPGFPWEAELEPPWLPTQVSRSSGQGRPAGTTLAGDAAEADLRTRYEHVPWIVPNHQLYVGDKPGSMGLEWRGLRIGYGKALEGEFKSVDGSSWWARLREVPSSAVALRRDHEKFLFYDGAIGSPAPVLVRWAGKEKQALSLQIRSFEKYHLDLDQIYERDLPPPTEYLPGVFVVRKQADGPPRGRLLRHLPPGKGLNRVSLSGLDLEGERLRSALGTLLEEEGLTPEETRSLLRTWERELFATDGLRVISVLPRWFYDAMLPIEVHPSPGELVRVGLVWKECRDLEVEPDAQESRRGDPVSVEGSRMEIHEEPLSPGPEAPLTIGPGGEIDGLPLMSGPPLLSGSGRKVLIPGFHDEFQAIHVADLERKTVRRLFTLSGANLDCCISGDGSRVAVIVGEPDGPAIYLADTDSPKLIRVLRSTEEQFTRISFSDDGRKLVFLRTKGATVVDLITTEASTLGLGGSRSFDFPVLSLDGSKLVLSRSLEEPETGEWREVMLFDFLERTARPLGRLKGTGGPASLSADKTRAIWLGEEKEGGATTMNLCDLREGHSVRLARYRDGMAGLPLISRDGRRVAYVLKNSIWLTDLDTGRSRQVWKSEPLVLDVSVSADTRRYLVTLSDGLLSARLVDLPEPP